MTVLTGHLNKNLLGWRRGISKQNTAIGLSPITSSSSRRIIGGRRSQRWSPGAICNKTRRGGIMVLGPGIHQGEVHGNRSLRLQTRGRMHPDRGLRHQDRWRLQSLQSRRLQSPMSKPRALCFRLQSPMREPVLSLNPSRIRSRGGTEPATLGGREPHLWYVPAMTQLIAFQWLRFL